MAEVFGWVIYGIIAFFCLSGLVDIFSRGRNPRGNISSSILFSWVLGLGCLIVFLITDFSKLHILWVMAVGGIISVTPIGRAVGILIGLVLRINIYDPSMIDSMIDEANKEELEIDKATDETTKQD